MEQLLFTRPFWFLALPPMAVMLRILLKNRRTASPWRGVVDAHLLAHLLIGQSHRRPLLPVLLLGLFWLLLITALAGPVWQRVPAVEFRLQVPPLVIVLDLSRSMNTRDVAPSRITLARAKLGLLLERLPQRAVALTVYTLRGHSVMPFTEDRRLVQQTLESLAPELMPVQGSLASAGLAFAGDQLRAFAAKTGELLLVTDTADAAAPGIAQQLAEQGYRVSVFAIGTRDGGPIPDEHRGFLLSDAGPVYSRLDKEILQQVANQGGGYFITVTRDDHDLHSLQHALAPGTIEGAVEQNATAARVWREGGPWLILIALPLFLVIARPETLIVALIFTLLPLPSPAQASGWQRLWLNRNQSAMTAFEAGEYQQAAAIFDDPLWRGIAQYRDGRFAAALQSFSQLSSPIAHYNRGNTLVKMGRLEEALLAYRETLRLSPAHERARFNLELIEVLVRHGAANTTPPDAADDAVAAQRSAAPQKEAATWVADMLDAPTENDRMAQSEGSNRSVPDAGSAGGGAMLISGGERTDLVQSSTVGEGLTNAGIAGGARDSVARQGGGGGTRSDNNKQLFRNQALDEEADPEPKPEGPVSLGNNGNADADGAADAEPPTAERSTSEPVTEETSTDKVEENPALPAGSGAGAKESAGEPSAFEEENLSHHRAGSGTGSGDSATPLDTGMATYDAMQNWIDALTDDTAELLREKFRREYQRAPVYPQGEHPW
ncbi:MAG: VWA domain-containing protein [Chromatiaceae bacterium]|nr:VWA domain-containing protein [Chromatiaceae bacterium]